MKFRYRFTDEQVEQIRARVIDDVDDRGYDDLENEADTKQQWTSQRVHVGKKAARTKHRWWVNTVVSVGWQ